MPHAGRRDSRTPHIVDPARLILPVVWKVANPVSLEVTSQRSPATESGDTHAGPL